MKPLPPKVVPVSPPVSGMRLLVGSVLMLVAVAAAGMMVLKHFIGIDLPGCGHGGACDQAAASRWGTIPGIHLPTSFLGFAYFLGMFAAWQAAVGMMSPPLRWLARLGALVSLGFLAVVVVEKLACPYCIAAHVANLLFVVVVETRRGVWVATRGAALAAGAAVFVTAFGALAGSESHAVSVAKAKQERELAESTAAMVNQKPPAATPGLIATPPKGTTAPVAAAVEAPVGAASTAAATPAGHVFSGRYRWGPESAPVRIVMFTDYQCPDCYKIEGELKELMKNPGVAVLIKMFPLSDQCNAKSPGNLHPNACWAARAAQTAGMLRGNDGFWAMHHWLFEHRGSFTDADFPPALTQMGYDAREFQRVMMSQEPLTRVKADIDEGVSLGIFFTPMIFINGVELRGWAAQNALTRAVNAVLASNPASRTMAEDQAPTAFEKMMGDWRVEPVRGIPDSIQSRYLGAADAPVSVVIFGDYREPGTQKADAAVREFQRTSGVPVRYIYAHFPVDQACNKVTQVTRYAGSCRSALAVEAAQLLKGPAAFWRMHAALMEAGGMADEAGLRAAAVKAGVDFEALRVAIDQPEAAAAVTRDTNAAAGLSIQSVPMILINGRYVPRADMDGESLLPFMMMEAYKGSKKPPR